MTKHIKFVRETEEFLREVGCKEVTESEFYSGKHFLVENQDLGKLAIRIVEEDTKSYGIQTTVENKAEASKYFYFDPYTGEFDKHSTDKLEMELWVRSLVKDYKDFKA